MNDLSITNQVNSMPTLAVKLRSWKWWVYGDVNSQPLKKPPKGFLIQVFVAGTLWLLIAVHPWAITWINRRPPDFSSLQIANGRAVSTSRNNPQLKLQLDSGEILEMEYPGFLNTFGTSPGGARSLGSNNEKVFGCRATVWFDIPRYTLWRRYRIWQIACEDEKVAASYNEITRSMLLNLIEGAIFAFLVLPILIGLTLARFKRGFYENF